MKESDGFMLSINEMVDRIRVVNQCMKHSIKEHDPDDSINEFLKEIGTAVNASAIYIYTLEKNHDYVCGFAWISEKDKTHEPVLALRGKDLAEEWRQKLDRRESISVQDLSSIAVKEPQAYKKFSQMGIRGMIMCPIIIEEELYGFVVFSNLDASYNQTENQLYEIDANFLAIMLRHQSNVTYIYENELEDKLTKLMNMRTFGKSLDTILMAVKYGRTDKEWDVVFFTPDGIAKSFNRKVSINDELRRLEFVAMTRARDRLHVTGLRMRKTASGYAMNVPLQELLSVYDQMQEIAE